MRRSPASSLSRVLSEPLLHFALMGGVLFALDAARSSEPQPRLESEAPRRIVVDASARTELREAFEKERGRPPNEAELERLVEGFIETELLYREGLRRDLAEDDPAVRQRVAGKMAFVLESQLVLPEPSEAELRDWFERHRERWRTPELFDFTHVFFSGPEPEARRRATETRSMLEGGATPATLGDRFSGGRRYRRRKLDDLAQIFGDEFASELARQTLGTWELRRSRLGVHVVRLDARSAAKPPDFASAKLDVRKDWETSQRAEHYRRELSKLRERWEIVRP